MYLGMIMMLGTMPLALIYGRVYCGWLCPMGGLLDNLLARISRNRPSPPWLRHPATRIAAVIFFGGLGLFFWKRFPQGLALNWRGVTLGPILLLMMTMMLTAITLGYCIAARPLRPSLPNRLSRGPAQPGEPLRSFARRPV